MLDKATADEYGWGEGDTVTVAGRAPKKDYTVSGVATLGDSENFGGSRLVAMTLPEAQRAGHDGYDDISVAADGGTSPEELKAAIAAELGPRFSVLTGKEQAEKNASDLSGRARLHPHGAAGVRRRRGAGRRLIFNTFNVTVAQRTREFALLHARRLAPAGHGLGAGRDRRRRTDRVDPRDPRRAGGRTACAS